MESGRAVTEHQSCLKYTQLSIQMLQRCFHICLVCRVSPFRCLSVSATYALSVLVHSDAAVLVFPHTCTQTVSESILKLVFRNVIFGISRKFVNERHRTKNRS